MSQIDECYSRGFTTDVQEFPRSNRVVAFEAATC
jgi:hypothetical protein